MRIFSFLFLCFGLNFLIQKGLAQSPTTGEEQLSLNGKWAFKTDPNNLGEDQKWFSPGYPALGWDKMEVPGNWDTHNEYAHYAGKGWYRKEIDVPTTWQGKIIRLNFEAVYHDAKVWLNGKLLGESHSGFFPFEFDVTKDLKYGGKNTIAVVADNTFKRGATWNWGGIRRPVTIYINNPVRIEQAHVLATPDLKNNTASVNVKLQLRNNSPTAQNITGSVRFRDKSSQVKGKELTYSLTLPPNATTSHSVQTNLTKAETHLWHFDDPYLYTVEVKVAQGNNLQHQVKDRFGIRKLEIDGLKVKLNGEEVRLMGYNWVPDDRTTGNTLPAWRYKADIDLMKKAGANMTRLSHLPLPKEVLDYIDEKGILVFSEIPLWGQDALVDANNPLPKQWLKQLVHSQFNHPSVIGWCVGNEIGYIGANPGVMAYVESAINYVKKELDNSRLVVYVSHSADNQKTDPVQFSDMILLNKYSDLGKQADKAYSNHPGKPMFYSEYGYNLTSENLNLGVIDAKGMLNSIRNREYLMGASLWTFNDYRSAWQAHAAWNTAPTGNRSWGIVNVFRQKKRAYEAFRKEYAPLQKLTVQHTGQLTPGQRVKTAVRMQPREKLDLPAYTLRNYKLVWEAQDTHGKVLQSGFNILPEIEPGDKTVVSNINWKVPAQNPGALKVTLLSPTGYDIYDTLVYLQKPVAPKIKEIIPGENGVRVLFEKNPTAKYYVVRYGKNDLSSRSDTTINHYLDIKKLDKDQVYQFAVAGINHLGEGAPSEPVKSTPKTDLLPPVIWYTEAADSSFFIGYGYENFDYLYTIQYGTDLNDPAKTKTIQVTTRGLCRVPNVANGQLIQFRMKRTVQQYVESGWSEIYTVTPDGNGTKQTPLVKSVSRLGEEAIIGIAPVPKAIGYEVRYQENNTNKIVKINSTLADYLVVQNLKKGRSYNFSVTAISQNNNSNEAAPAGKLTTSTQK